MGFGALALALAAGLWYLSSAPSRGRAVEPGGASVMASATQAGTGSWVRYTISVTNYGSQDFEGDVVLLNHGDQSTPDGAGLPSLGRVDKVPTAASVRFPATAPDAAYQVHLRLAGGRQHQLSVTVPERYEVIEVRSPAGAVLFTGPVEGGTVIPIAVLSRAGAVADAVGAVTAGEFPIHVVAVADGRQLPARASGLNGFAELVLDQFDTAGLSRGQAGALRDFVGLGGTLVLVTGPDWRRTLAGIPLELQPLRPKQTQTADLHALADLGRLAGDFSGPIATGDLAPGARVLAGDRSAPLAVALDYGAGRVVELAFDPASEPVSSSRLGPAAWTLAVSSGLAKAPGATPGAFSLPGPNPIPAGLFPAPGEPALPAPALVGAVVLAYILLVGPLNLVLSRRLRKPDLLWITTPLIAVVATASFYGAGLVIQGGNRDDEVQVLKAGPAAAADLQYHRLLFHQRGQHTIDLGSGVVGAPLTLPLYQATGAGCARCVLQLSGLRQNVEEHVVNSSPAQVVETGVAYGNVRMIGTLSVDPGVRGLEATLAANGGQITGTLRNLGGSTVRNLSLYSSDAEVLHRTLLAGSIAPGRTVSVAGLPRPAELDVTRIPAGISEDQLLANSLAQAAVFSSGSPLLIGMVDPTPSRLVVDGHGQAASARAFLEQPVTLAGADSLLADFTRVRLVARSGDSRSGLLDVYDFELPRSLGTPLRLSFDRGHASGTEVYDWAAQSWRPGPWTEDPVDATRLTGDLMSSEVSGGVVRVRVREPRTGWGSFISVLGTR